MSKRKAYDKNKRAQRFFSNTRLWSWESRIEPDGSPTSHAEVKRGAIWQPLSQNQVDGIRKNNNNWTVCYRILTQYDDGEVRLHSEFDSFRNSKIIDLGVTVGKFRQSLLSKIQKRHILDAGWLAQSFLSDPRDNEGFENYDLDDATDERKMLWNYGQESLAYGLKTG